MIKKIILNNGLEMPEIGLGTHAIPNDELPSVLSEAYEIGYRKFDTAWLYHNEDVIGKWISNASINRESIFLTSKLHLDDMFPWGYRRQFHIPLKSVERSFHESCKRLHTDYLDLYLIHWPFVNYLHLWEEMIKLYEKGYVKAIGVSSFLVPHMKELSARFGRLPMVNQFEINPYNTQKETISYCQDHKIHVEAYATFGTRKTNDVASRFLLEDEHLLEIARKYNKSTSQIILKWALQQGVSVIPRSRKMEHLAANIYLYDFKLNNTDMMYIDSLNMNLYHRDDPHSMLS